MDKNTIQSIQKCNLRAYLKTNKMRSVFGPFTLDVWSENVTVCVPLGVLLVVVNMTVRSAPFKVTAICGLPSRVCILHTSHSSFVTEPLYLSVATKTYDGGSPSGKSVLGDRKVKVGELRGVQEVEN